MTLDDLRVFVAVCRAGSLSAVARELGCTQSAVSQHVRRLEREVGVGLVERQARGVVPTRAGRVLERAAAEGISGLDLALRRLDEMVRGGGGVVRVATGGATVRHFMADAVVDFRRRYPQVTLEFQTESSSRSCFDALGDHGLDLAWVTFGPPVRGIEQRAAVELPWVLAVRADDELAARERVEGEELAGLRLIGLPENSTSRAHLDTAYRELGVPAAASDTSVADWDTAILLAELGLGHAVVPALPTLRGPGHPGLRFLPIPALPPLTVGWAVRQWDALSPPARAFADTVTHHCRTQSGTGTGTGTDADADAEFVRD
ncbi:MULTISPECIES: LysR family transcriptional regulator [unclassified Streptomyces]|uniref:LysR family transcriptional regulator n=1 Tax=unclassified Streptomyces TaxID=2593676 RepID=UPI002E7FBB1F|nr:LysR family transcriptional regulator [Streptomyces sp. NBC_00589]WTI39550.1 LysR family transcriptional regulator [Streptomyces sp. NBC_00775]WUB26771.1 LysR family transcriptional regulator [Streptomyces sp. NBC_00589]